MNKWIAAGLIAVGSFGYVSPNHALALHMSERKVPKCAEDEVIAGRGNFAHGYWERYVCTHPDDITAETIENDYRNPAVYATVRGSVCDHRRFWNREVGIKPSVEETCH